MATFPYMCIRRGSNPDPVQIVRVSSVCQKDIIYISYIYIRGNEQNSAREAVSNKGNTGRELSLSNRDRPTCGVTMATQTEWNLWGTPESSNSDTISPTRRRHMCDCEGELRHLREWKRDHERQEEKKDHQNKAKMNSLRQKLMDAEDERSKMKATISSLSKQIANNTAAIAEMKIRSEGDPRGPKGPPPPMTQSIPNNRPNPNRRVEKPSQGKIPATSNGNERGHAGSSSGTLRVLSTGTHRKSPMSTLDRIPLAACVSQTRRLRLS